MPSLIQKLIPNSFATFGWLLIFWGLFCIFLAYIYGENPDNITYAFGFGSFGVGFISIGIAFHSMARGEESDKRVKDIANTNFLGIVSDIEDRRIEIQHFPDWRRINVWKSLVHMEQAQELLKFCDIRSEHQIKLADIYNRLLELLDVTFLTYLCCEEVAHILRIYLIVSNLETDDDIKEETNTLIMVLLDEDDTYEINDDIITILLERISEFDYEDFFILCRDEIKNYFV